MRALLSRPFLCLMLVGASTGPSEQSLSQGASIYADGVGQRPIKARLMASRSAVSAQSFPCAACHGEDGTGGREGDVVAPDLTAARSMTRSALVTWLQHSVVQGRGRNGEMLSSAMPRYTLSPPDLDALADYVGTLPYPAVPGVGADEVAISLDPAGAGLTIGDIALLRAAIEARSAAINAMGGLFGRRVRIVGAREAAFAALSWTAQPPSNVSAPLSVLTGDESMCGSLFPDESRQKDALEKAGKGARLIFPANLDQHLPVAQAFIVRDASSQKAATSMALMLSGMDMLIANLRTEGRRIQPKRYCNSLATLAREQQHVTIELGGEIVVQKLSEGLLEN